MAEITAEEFMQGTEVPTSAPVTNETTKVSKPFKDEDFPGYLALVKSKRTTGEVLNNWLEQKGYGRSANADQIIEFSRANPNAVIENKYVQNGQAKRTDDSAVPSAVGPERSVSDSLGMGARGLITGAGSLVDVAAGPLNMLVNALPGEQGLSTTPFRDAGAVLSDWLGFAVPETDREKLINAVNEGGIQGLLTFGAGSALGQANTAAGAVGKALTASPVADVIGGSVGLGASEQTRQMGGGPVAQLAAALVGGGVSAVTASKVARSLARNPRAIPEQLLKANEIDPASLPEGVTSEAAAAQLPALNALQDEAAAFKTTPEPEATDLFPTDASRMAKAEAWGESLGAPSQKLPESPSEPVPTAEAPEPTLSKKDADKLFQEAAAPVKAQTTKEWEKSLKASADEFQAAKETPKIADNGELLVPSVRDPVVSVPARTDRGMPHPESLSGDVVTNLTNALNNAAKIGRKVQDRLTSQARREKLSNAKQANIAAGGGEAGMKASLAALKGEIPKADFEAVRSQFTDDNIASLFSHLDNHPKLQGYDQLNAKVALSKLLDGQIPTRSEIKLLDQVFPPSFVRAAGKNRSTLSKLGYIATNGLNLPRSIMSTFDLSAPLRQGVFLVGRKEFYKGFANMFKMFGSEKAYQATMDSIKSHPNYPWMEEARLGLTEMGGSLSKREEAFMSDWAEKIPVFGRGAKASNRAYSGFLNKLRADTFNTILEQGKAAGINLVDDPKFVRDIATFVNNATGRGSLGPLSQAGPVLNGLFFSPRLMASRVAMLNPATYATLHPIVRKEAVKSLLAFGTIATTVMGLAAAGGLSVESDPRSSDFAKIKNGNTRYDILGGFGQYITLGARLATNETKTMKGAIKTMGQSYGSPTRLDAVVKFLTNKESPVASFVTDYLRGQNAIGEPFEVRKAIVSRMLPLLAQDVAEAYQERGAASTAAMAPGLFGVGVQNFNSDTKSKTDFLKGEAVAGSPDPAPSAKPEPAVIKDTLSAEDFMKGTEVKP